jgi:hypothetical protein
MEINRSFVVRKHVAPQDLRRTNQAPWATSDDLVTLMQRNSDPNVSITSHGIRPDTDTVRLMHFLPTEPGLPRTSVT